MTEIEAQARERLEAMCDANSVAIGYRKYRYPNTTMIADVRNLLAALQSRTALDREAYERAAEVADEHVAPKGVPQSDYDEACNDIASAIRNLSSSEPNHAE